MDHIHYSKNVLDPVRFKELKELCVNHVQNIPTYNFCRKTEDSSNYLEEIIRHLIGRDNHVEYWVRNNTDSTLFHVDANELEQKILDVKNKGVYQNVKPEFPLNTHVFFVDIHPEMQGGDLYILPDRLYQVERPILDTSFQPEENDRLLRIKPIENELVFWTKPIYHCVSEVRNTQVVKNRISFMFSSWDYVPKVYEKHEHWGNYNNDFAAGKQHEPQPMEFDIK